MKLSFSKSLIGLGVAAMVAGTGVFAQENTRAMDAEKKALIIGEMANGYLGFVKPATEDQIEISRKVNEINAARRTEYAKIAEKNGQTIDAAALTIARIQIADKTKIGEYFKDKTGTWCKKSSSSIIEAKEDGTITILCK